MNEQEVRDLLGELADTPAPPPRVDVPRAVAVARRRTRVRVWTTTAAASVLVVGLAVGVTHAVAGDSSDTVAGAPERFDPLVEYASFGWLPEKDKLNQRSTAVNDVRFATSASQYLPDPDNGTLAAMPAASVDVSFYAAGVQPQSELPLDVWGPTNDPSKPYAPVTNAPPVNGTPAYWVSVPDDPEVIILKWRYAPDAWAEVTVARLDGDLRESAHRVASELRFGGTERFRFPFHFTGLPEGLRPVATNFAEGGLAGPWRVDLELSTENQELNARVSLDPILESEKRDPNTTVDGHEARRDTTTGDPTDSFMVPGAQVADQLFVYDDPAGVESGFLVAAKTPADAAPLGQDGALTLYRAFTVHPDHADWTDQPLR